MTDPCGCRWEHKKGSVTWFMCERHKNVPAGSMIYEGDLFLALRDLVAAVTPVPMPPEVRPVFDRAAALVRKIDPPPY